MESAINHVAQLAIRQAGVDPTTPSCTADNDYNGEIGARISAVCVILVGSIFGEFDMCFTISYSHPVVC